MQKPPSPEEFSELFVGTWIALALITDILVRLDLVRRDDLVVLLSGAAAGVNHHRCIPLTAVRNLLENLSDDPVRWPHCRGSK